MFCPDTITEQEYILRHDSQLPPQPFQVDALYGHTVDEDRAGRSIVQPSDQFGQRAFATTGMPTMASVPPAGTWKDTSCKALIPVSG
jgi:hypothetical protein